MKKYFEFIKEIYITKTVKFAIDLRGDVVDTIPILFNSALNYFSNSDYLKEEFEYIIARLESTGATSSYTMPPWAIVFEYTKNKYCHIFCVTTPNWGENEDYMENILTVDKFLSIGFENIEVYLDSKKYNL